ncbi:MobF family relaxase [Nocardia bhagyanarayanae]|uniref:MobF family relaxase n=1 Tax=Nocardia bhagyanarayanae TaxID=1215925 RepID=UPI00163B0325|nr:MobF family relaxase [Nocardia bhagyanarayanae]
MTATIHKIVAGTGYLYYLRRVAAHDDPSRGRTSLADYYSERGEAPGRWLGSGLPALGIAAGEKVTEEQMRNLLGVGVHPNADLVEERVFDEQIGKGAKPKDARRWAQDAALLGNPFRIYPDATDYRKRCGMAFAAHNIERGFHVDAEVSEQDRSRIRTDVATEMFDEQYGRAPLDERELSAWVAQAVRPRAVAVAGFDICFSPVKSVSALWAVAPKHISDKIELAHRRAVADAIAWLEANGIYTRLGRNGIRQVEVDGVVAMVFDHRTSRAGDPALHSHVPIANRVRVRKGPAAGQWRTVDGTVLYQSVVAVSEIYNTRLEHHLLDLVGVVFADRPGTDPPIREMVGVPDSLIRRWSRRDAAIVSRLDQLTTDFQRALGREPTAGEVFELAERATLATRPAKQFQRTRAEERAFWRAEAVDELGSREALAAMITCVLNAARVMCPVVTPAWIAAKAASVLEAVSARRSTWQRHHVVAEVQRQVRGILGIDEWARVSQAVEDAVLSAEDVIALGDPDAVIAPEIREMPAVFRRADSIGVHVAAGSQIYTSTHVLAVGAQLVELSVRTGARTLTLETVAAAIDRYTRANADRPLLAGQIAIIEAFATSTLRVRTADAPAGSGKTTAMNVLTDAWHDSGGTVLGLAPTASAAGVLSESIGARAETVDRLLHVLNEHTPRPDNPALHREHPPALPEWVREVGPDTLVIVDEHILLSDRKRLQLLKFFDAAGSTVRCIGDEHQLPAIEAGGAYADMADACPEPDLTLTHVVRFADDLEATASLGVRAGDPAALGWYLDHGRVHAGHRGTSLDDTYTAWHTDHTAGRDTIMLAATREAVTALNTRARADRLARTTTAPGPECVLADGCHASLGDIIRTRLNNSKLRLGDRDWVRNGYTWTVTAVHPDGSITATHRRSGRDTDLHVVLSAKYVAAHVDLGYAATIDSAQGITTDTCHVALTGTESRQQLYVALTRGRYANHLYLATALGGGKGEEYTLAAAFPRTAVEALIRILGRDRRAKSAHTTLREALDPRRRLGRALDIYLDTISLYAEHTVLPETLAAIDTAAEAIHLGLTHAPAYPVLRGHLALLALTGTDPITALRTAAATRELDSADDPAAVLDWRLDTSGAHSGRAGPLPWTRVLPRDLDNTSPELAHITARGHVVTELAQQISVAARAWTPATAPVWARPFLDTKPELLADLAVWRAALHVPDDDLNPTGPRRFPVLERHHQQRLDERVRAAIGDPNRPSARWQPLAHSINPRLTSDPFWPSIAEKIDTAARSGLPITDMLTTAALERPLPDELPATALWARLHIEPASLDTTTAPLRPDWTTHLTTVLGAENAEHVLNDPAWPRLVAAIDTATRHGWSPTELLYTAHELLLTTTGHDTPPLRPHQLATALTWRVEILTRTDLHTPTPPEEPPMPDPATAEPAPENPERTSTDDHQHLETPASTNTPRPGHASAIPHQDVLGEIATLFRDGRIADARAQFTALTTRLSDEQRDILTRIADTLYRYPYPNAVARLTWAAQYRHPKHADLIHACTPTADPRTHQPDTPKSHQPVQPHARRVDPTRRRESRTSTEIGTQQHSQHYFDHRAHVDEQPDHLPTDGSGAPHHYDTKARWEDRLADSDPPDYDKLTVRRDRALPCVECGIDRSATEIRPPKRRSDDGLCLECRDDDKPGIPDHDPRDYITARCDHIASINPPEHVTALLKRDWRTAVTLSDRIAILTWIDNHPKHHPLRRLTDQELTQRINELEQQLTLASTDAFLYTPTNPDTTDNDDAVRKAIQAARTAERRRDNAEHAMSEAAAELDRQQRALDATPTHHHHEREHLQLALQDTTTRHQRLLRARTTARQHAHHTHKRAVRLAGPPETWATVLHQSMPIAASNVLPTEVDDIDHELRQLRAEQQRRTQLDPTRRDHESRLRNRHQPTAFDTEIEHAPTEAPSGYAIDPDL